MNCQRALEQIDLILDDGENPGAELYSHLSTCAECRRRFDSYKRVENRLRSAAVRPVVRETPARGLKVIERRTWFRTLGLVAAACVMLACAIAAYVSSRPKEMEIVKPKEMPPAVLPLPKLPELRLPEKMIIAEKAPEPTLEKILAAPQNAFKSEGEKMLSDVRAIESFLLRCLPIASRENRG